MLSSWPLHHRPLRKRSQHWAGGGDPAWGRGMEKMTSGQLHPTVGTKAQSGRDGPGLGANRQPCGLAREEQGAAGQDEIFRSPHPQKVETDKQNEMLRCNYPGRPSMSPCRRRAQHPQPTTSRHWVMKSSWTPSGTSPQPPPLQARQQGDGKERSSGSTKLTLSMAEQDMQRAGGWGQSGTGCPGQFIYPTRAQLLQPENGPATPCLGRGTQMGHGRVLP